MGVEVGVAEALGRLDHPDADPCNIASLRDPWTWADV